jgi:hypothetical protein
MQRRIAVPDVVVVARKKLQMGDLPRRLKGLGRTMPSGLGSSSQQLLAPMAIPLIL